VALRRRLAVLESKLMPVKAIYNLDAEIRVMTATERSALRDVLLLLKSDGQPDDKKFSVLEQAAEQPVGNPRLRDT
jgi:hypothetical protein